MSAPEDDALLYHSRHILLDEIGVEGQERIGEATALIVGMGGLGCPAATYLVSSGIGTLIIVDGDDVDMSNLQRQTIYRKKDLDKPKVLCAEAGLKEMGRMTEIVPVQQRLTEENAAETMEAADVVLDGSDNFPTRHLVNRSCCRLGKPLVSGAAIRFEAQASVFDFRRPDSPCYACLFSPDAEHEETPCSLLGVLAPLTGMIGCLMAIEALKILAIGSSTLQGKLLLVDALGANFRGIKVSKDPACPVCSQK